MKLCKEPEKLPFRKEMFDVTYHFYLCEATSERFTTNELDYLNTIQVYNQYREKYGIPFPEEIKSIREKYGVSATKMSEILGFGTNIYRLYESGEMPSVSNGRLILSVKDPDEFSKQVHASSHILTGNESTKLLKVTERILQDLKARTWEIMFLKNIFGDQPPNEFNGFRSPDLNRISHVISFFHQKGIDLFKTKLNKLLFYTDFNCFQASGYSLTGLAYKAIQYGPVPAEFEKLFIKLSDDEKISLEEVQLNSDTFRDIIISHEVFDEFLFSETEKEVLEFIVEKFQREKTSNLVAFSHQESAWKVNEGQKQLISYPKFAFDLQGETSFLTMKIRQEEVL
jgi:uncharacterized phage-associated protein/DNA-binding transcriptional regulator YiaG